MIEKISKKDEIMIALLGRQTFPIEELKNIITKNKRNPNAYLRGYNACNGKNTVTEISKIIGVNQSTITPILQDWELKGIIFKIEKAYRKLYSLPVPKEKNSKRAEDEERITDDVPIQEIQNQNESIQEEQNEEEVRENE
jgi:DNA-binding MarR family transcriptional regulator